MTPPKPNHLLNTAIFGLLLASPTTTHAANFTWTGKAGNDNWNQSTNWDPAAPATGPIATDDVFFGEGFLPGGTDPFPTGDIDLNGADRHVNSLSIDHNATQTIIDAGNILGLNSGILTRDGSGDHQIDAGIRLFKDGIWTINGPGRLDINAAIDPNAAGAFGLVKEGTGNLRFEGTKSNGLTGKYSVKAGTLTLAKSSGVSALSNNVVLNGGTLLHAADENIPNTATVEMFGGAYNLAGFTETFDTLKGSSGSIDLAGGNLTITTLDTPLNIQNPGTLTVSDGDHTGNLTNATAATLNKNSAGTLKLSGNNTIDTLNVNAGTLDLSTGSLTTTSINATGNINIATGTLTTGLGTISGTISGAGQLVLNGPGSFNSGPFTTIAGTTPNTHTGLTTITNAASVHFGKSPSTNAIGGNLLIEDLSTLGNQLVADVSEQIPNTATVTLAGGDWLTTGTLTETITHLNFTGTGTTGSTVSSIGGDFTLAVLGNITHTSASAFTGTIGNVTLDLSGGTRTIHTAASSLLTSEANITNGGITKTGSGTVIFADASNTYTGLTTVQAGTLQLQANTNAAFAGNLLINAGTVLYEQNHQIPDNSTININATGTFDLNNKTDTVGFIGGSAGATIDLGSGHLTTNTGGTFSGVITGPNGRLTLNSSFNPLTLSGNTPNTYTGLTTVNANTLNLGKNHGQSAIGGNLTINNTATARLLNNDQIPDTATVTVNPGGTFNLHTAATETINTLNANGTVELSGGHLTTTNLNGNGTIELSGGHLTTTNLNGNGTIGTTTGTLTAAKGSFTGTIQGASVALEKTGTGTLTLTGNNNYAAGTTLNGGTLALGHSNAAGTGTITTFNGHQAAVLSDGPLLYWNFDEASGNAQDQITNFAINALAPQGSVGRVDSTIGLGRAAEFTGAGGMRFFSDSLFTGAASYNHYAIELYVQLDDPTRSSYLLEAGTNEDSDPDTHDDIHHPALIHGFGPTDKLEAFFGADGRTGAAGPTNLTDNLWHHLVLEVNTAANNHTIFIDGTPFGPFTGATTWNLPRLAVGTILGVTGANPTDGRIDELAFYDLATNPITAQDIADHTTAATLIIDFANAVTVANPIQLQSNIKLNIDTGSATHTGLISELTEPRTVTKTGPGRLALNNPNTYTGGTFINGGTLALGHSNAAGTGPITVLGSTIEYTNAVNIPNPIDLQHQTDLHVPTGAATQSGTISETAGPWSITKTGPGNLTLNANNTHSGGTFISGGTLTLAHNNAAGTGDITVLGSTIAYADGVNIPNPIDLQHHTDLHVAVGSATQSGIITQTAGPWDVTKTGPGNLTLNAGTPATPSAFGSLLLQDGTTTLDGAHLNLTKSTSLNATNASLTLQNAAALNMANQGIIDNAALTLTDTGTSLTGNTLLAGVNPATISSVDVLDNASLNVNDLIFGAVGEGHLLASQANVAAANKLNLGEDPGILGTATFQGNSTLADATTINVGLSGIGQLTAQSSATVTANRVDVALFAGSTGTALIQSNASLDINTFLNIGVQGTGNLTAQTNAIATTANLTLGGLSFAFLGGTGTVSALTGASLNVTNATTFFTNTSAIIADGGTFSTGSLTEHTAVLADIQISDPNPSTPAFTIGTNNTNSTINGIITDATTGPGSLSKTGTGTLTLNGHNTYTGTTTIAAGTLAGSGSIAGPVTVNPSATIAPGNSPGTLTLGDTLTLNTGATLAIEVAPTEADLLAITAGASLAGTLAVTPLPDPDTLDDIPLGTEFTVMTFANRGAPAAETMFDNITGTLLSTAFALAPLFNTADTNLTLRATIPGDLNLDNKVSVADLSTFALNFNTTPGLYVEATDTNSWQLGDFNADGAITVADLSLLALNFGFDPSDPTSTPLGLSIEDLAATFPGLAGLDLTSGTLPSVPEPTTLALLLPLALRLTTHRPK